MFVFKILKAVVFISVTLYHFGLDWFMYHWVLSTDNFQIFEILIVHVCSGR